MPLSAGFALDAGNLSLYNGFIRLNGKKNETGEKKHMTTMKLYAFADEASPELSGQIAALKRNGLQGLEIRTVDGENISAITAAKAREVRARLDDEGLTVWSIGSPIGKIDIRTGDYPAELEKLRHTLELAAILGAENLRMFSFYLPAGESPKQFRQEVLDRLGQMADIAEGTGVTLCHENEKGIYGDVAFRCLEIHHAVPAIRGVFDPANFIQCGQDTWEAWALLFPFIKYLHVKDALADGSVVPAGKGIGNVARIVAAFRALGRSPLTIEPHLTVFSGLSALERAGEESIIGRYAYDSSDKAFDAACEALRGLLAQA